MCVHNIYVYTYAGIAYQLGLVPVAELLTYADVCKLTYAMRRHCVSAGSGASGRALDPRRTSATTGSEAASLARTFF